VTVVVLGSINVDLVATTPRLPRSGETVRATSLTTYPGGKGANQAVAAARLGAGVRMIGRVGGDEAGALVLRALADDGVDTTYVAVDDSAPTGTALITVADDGSNTIITSGGANHEIGDEEVAALKRCLSGASVLLVQLEVPIRVIEAAVELAAADGIAVVLDPAPIPDPAVLPSGIYERIAWITPNETEGQALTGIAPWIDAEGAAAELRKRGVEHVVITLGSSGCFYLGPSGGRAIGTPEVEVIDTVACGDAFNGALAASLVAGRTLVETLEDACAAGAAAATRRGAYPSLPRTGELTR
jgi:ribokinase